MDYDKTYVKQYAINKETGESEHMFKASKDNNYKCIYCEQNVTIIGCGSKKRRHFRHFNNSSM